MLNIRSALNRYDDIVDRMRADSLDVFLLIETWHDTDSAVFGRLRQDGFAVVDCPRLRLRPDDLSVNHGGVAVLSAPTVRLSPVQLSFSPATFEFVCARASAASSLLVVVIYRPGSDDPSVQFIDEVGSLLDLLAVRGEPVIVAGDLNIRLDRPVNSFADQLRFQLESVNFSLLPSGPTHRLGGVLDVVAVAGFDVTASADMSLKVDDVGISDHFMLRWRVPIRRLLPHRVVVRSRPWRRLDVADFRIAVSTSSLCTPEVWPSDVDGVADLYESTLTCLLDARIPFRQFERRPRSSDVWFDHECLAAKRLTRRFERRCASVRRRSSSESSPSLQLALDAWHGQRLRYRQLRHSKARSFWRDRITSQQTDPRRLWRSVDTLLGRGRSSVGSSLTAEDFCRHFVGKVEGVRSSTLGAPPPTFSLGRSPTTLSEFSPTSVEEVLSTIGRLPDKSSAADPIPTSVLKDCAGELAPFVAHLFNTSVATGQFPAAYKTAFLTPIVKKAGLDVEDVRSYRPISNLTVVSKVMERLIVRRLSDYISAANLLPSLQSGFRPLHSTETAILKVLSDLLLAVDRGDVAVLALLDLSAAFDTVDHEILLRRLEVTFGITGTALRWLRSYLTDRHQFVRLGVDSSEVVRLLSGVPQGSVLGPILFILYVVDLIQLIQSMNLSPHLYADDSQLYGSCRPDQTASLADRVATCVNCIASWMRSNRLQLNADKSEVVWIASSRRQHQLPIDPLIFDGQPVRPVKSVRNLGIYLDSDLSMRCHVSRTVSRCFAALRQLQHVRRVVPVDVFRHLVVALVLSRLDYANGVLAGLPANLLRRLQSVLNAGARLIYGLRRYDHVTDALLTLHWLRMKERVQFKLAVLTFRVLHGVAPVYLGPFRRAADQPGRSSLRSASSHHLIVPRCKLTTVGARAFIVAAPSVWNSLPAEVVSTDSLPTFRRRLKAYLFRISYPDIVL